MSGHSVPNEVQGFPMRRARLNSNTGAAGSNGDLLAAMLDEVDYPMLLVSQDLRVLHLNAAAVEQFGDQDAFAIDQELNTSTTRDQSAMARAVKLACTQGKRSFIQVRRGTLGLLSASVVPLARAGQAPAALLILAKRSLCQELSLHGFARENQLTDVETRVLRLLCAGLSVHDIADAHNVKISTVRTQMTSLRSKTGAKDIRDIVFQLAVLPPVLSALRHQACRASEAAAPEHAGATAAQALQATAPSGLPSRVPVSSSPSTERL